MDTDEHDELLYRLDERTERIEHEHLRRLENVEAQTAENSATLNTIDDRVQKNETRINIAAGSLGAVGTAVLAWLGKFMGLFKGI